MVVTAAGEEESSAEAIEVNLITLDHPWRWIEAGWSDFRRAPGISLTIGIVFVAFSYLLVTWLYLSDRLFLVPPLAAGFFLLAPFLALGFYQVSRHLERDELPDMKKVLTIWRVNPYSFLTMGLVLMLLLLAWMMAANLVFAIFYTGITPKFENMLQALFFSGDSPSFLLAGVIFGSLFAFAAFTISVVAVPMLLDRRVDVLTAVRSSVSAVRLNPRPLTLWAALIVMFIGLGLVTFFVGLAIFMPLMGYASWHAYRDLVNT